MFDITFLVHYMLAMHICNNLTTHTHAYTHTYILVIQMKPIFVVSKHLKPSLCWFRNK